jgi:hypothetical protein
MANALYDFGRDGFLQGLAPWTSSTVSAALVQITGSGSPYTVDLVNDQFLSAIPDGAVAAVAPSLSGKLSAGGVATLDDFVFSGVPVGPTCGAVVFYLDTSVAATSLLLAYVDSAAGLPVTPNAGNISIAIDPVNKLFKL